MPSWREVRKARGERGIVSNADEEPVHVFLCVAAVVTDHLLTLGRGSL